MVTHDPLALWPVLILAVQFCRAALLIGKVARLQANSLGDNPVPDAAFIIEFPDRKKAEDFWNSKEFQTLAVLRRSGSTLNAIIVDALG